MPFFAKKLQKSANLNPFYPCGFEAFFAWSPLPLLITHPVTHLVTHYTLYIKIKKKEKKKKSAPAFFLFPFFPLPFVRRNGTASQPALQNPERPIFPQRPCFYFGTGTISNRSGANKNRSGANPNGTGANKNSSRPMSKPLTGAAKRRKMSLSRYTHGVTKSSLKKRRNLLNTSIFCIYLRRHSPEFLQNSGKMKTVINCKTMKERSVCMKKQKPQQRKREELFCETLLNRGGEWP
jgi:hypothetical protein